MNAQELRTWLQTAVGESINFQGVDSANMQGAVPAATADPNDSCELYFPIQVERLQKNNGLWELRVSNSTMAIRHGVYLPDYVNQCTRVNASANQIVFSGQFSGCTFVRCIAKGEQFVGHIYVKRSEPGNNPAVQAQRFEMACGAQSGTAVGFKTLGRVLPPASRGYVVGTCIANVWQWNWMTVDPNMIVVACAMINPDQWVTL